ncbi:hypothetical protein CLV56_1122 [Mumia flava]|uniref:Uncharacterized protein n=1 Tax=Mumia flava TaxID=1348852 RepID=A0A0B2BML5_9ACTN|nr:hypothetical protein [Mumia flava]PJJ56906.1 hypothetical protein CLV56_1122 [Mumia flava]
MGTGLIFAAVIAVWVAYGVPLALRRHEEATRDGSITTFSHALRVLTHRRDDEADDGADAPASASRSLAVERVQDQPAPPVTDETAEADSGAPDADESEPEAADEAVAEEGDESDAPDSTEGSDAARAPVASTATTTPRPRPRNRAAARRAARRRRRVLGVLLLATLVVGVLAGTGVLLPWSVAIPSGLVVAWLVLCRVMVRQERGITARPRAGRPAQKPRSRTPSSKRPPSKKPVAKQPKARRPGTAALAVDPDDEATVVLSGQIGDIEPPRKNVMEEQPLREGDLDQQIVDAVAVTTTTGTTLWDPVPVTLPTYVTKPAARTVRTVEFTSSDESSDDRDAAREARRAVGD